MKIFEAIKTAFADRAKPALAKKGEIVDIYGRPVKDALEYFYPKQITGIPVFSVDSIYNHYKDLIKEVKRNSGIGDHRMDDGVARLDYLFSEVIKRYIEYIHMLPASENHHHSTPGGMIVHSLEASAHAQKYAKEHKPDSLGMQDLDKQALPVYRYAAWLATFMHDAGKVLRDIVVDAVDVESKGKNIRVSNKNPIPSWQPQKESLVSWAKRFNVATYSVTYVKDRIHNQHNVDSVQLLQPVLGKGKALEYILNSPADVHSRLVRVLAGHDNGKDFIASSVRRGDMLSTSRNVAMSAGNVYLTEQSLSAPAKIYKAMKMAKQNWSYNTMNADVWVIGGEVYLRYTKTFHSIIKTANKNGLTIPNDIHVITMIMEESGITEAFDPKHKSVKFVQGEFSDKQLNGMLTGQEIVTWMELVKVKWKGLLFGDEPMPDSEKGVFYMAENNELIEVNEIGEFKPFTPNQNTTAIESHTDINHQSSNDGEQTIPAPTPQVNTAPTQQVDTPPASTGDTKSTSTKVNHKKVIDEAKKAPKKPKPTLVFKNQKPKPPADIGVEESNQVSAQDTPVESAKDSEPNSSQSGQDSSSQSVSDNKVKDEAAPVEKPKAKRKKKGKGKSQSDIEAVSLPDIPSTTKKSDVEVDEKVNSSPAGTDTKQDLKSEPYSLVAISRITEKVKVFGTKQQPGSFIAVNDAMEYLGETSKPALVKKLVEADVAILKEGKPVILLELVDGQKQQIIEVDVVPGQVETNKKVKPANKPKSKPDNKSKKNNSPAKKGPGEKPVSKKSDDKESVKDKPSIDDVVASASESKEDVADYGLLMRLSAPRKGSLGYYIKLVLDGYDADSDYRDFVIESGEHIAINATRLVDKVKQENEDSRYQLRHLLKNCRAVDSDVERKQIGSENFVQVKSSSLLDIDIEV